MILSVPLSRRQRPRVRKGQRVTIELDLPSSYRAILLLLVLPLIGLITGAVVGQNWTWLAARANLPTPLISVLFGLVGGGVLLGIGIGLERKAAAQRKSPRLILSSTDS